MTSNVETYVLNTWWMSNNKVDELFILADLQKYFRADLADPPTELQVSSASQST